MSSGADLYALRARPFELLQELERRARELAVGTDTPGGLAGEWVGIAFRCGGQTLLAARDHVREVMTLPAATRVPGAVHWVRGLANVRGQLLALTDLQAFVGNAAIVPNRSTRVIVVNHRSVPAGLIVDEVAGLRRLAESEKTDPPQGAGEALAAYVSGAFVRDDQVSLVVDLQRLVESERFLQAVE